MNKSLPSTDFIPLKYRENEKGCWNFIGGLDSYGYGVIWVNPYSYRANRIAYKKFHGVDPGDNVVCHSCDNPTCINPKHLFLGSHKDNMSDARAKGIIFGGTKTHCPNGHERTVDNTTKAGRCKICMRASSKRRQANGNPPK